MQCDIIAEQTNIIPAEREISHERNGNQEYGHTQWLMYALYKLSEVHYCTFAESEVNCKYHASTWLSAENSVIWSGSIKCYHALLIRVFKRKAHVKYYLRPSS